MSNASRTSSEGAPIRAPSRVDGRLCRINLGNDFGVDTVDTSSRRLMRSDTMLFMRYRESCSRVSMV